MTIQAAAISVPRRVWSLGKIPVGGCGNGYAALLGGYVLHPQEALT